MTKTALKNTAFFAALLLTAALPLSLQKEARFSNTLTAYADDDEETYTEGEQNGLQYLKYSDHIEISGCDSSLTEVKIPSQIESLPVTKIDANVGGFCAMKTLTLPDTLEEIEPYAFSWCENLESVTLPDSLKLIDFQAFEYCPSLKTVNFPDHLVKTSSLTFNETPWLAAQRQKDPLVIVNGAVIDGRTCKGAVTIPSDVKYVAASAFSENNDLTSVVFPASIDHIEDNMFGYCENLTSVELKGSTSLAYGVFASCNKLKELKLSGKLKSINGQALTDNTSTATITFYGTEESWNAVERDPDDAFLNRANMVFDPTGGDPEEVIGDINGDGTCDKADAALLLNWLIAKPDTTLANWKAGDLNDDGKLNAVDLTLLKSNILNK